MLHRQKQKLHLISITRSTKLYQIHFSSNPTLLKKYINNTKINITDEVILVIESTS